MSSNHKCIVIPAAGASTRLGQPKQLVRARGKALVRLAVEEALEVVSDVIVVVGFEQAAVRREIEGSTALVVENRDWKEGMGKSIAVGVRSALDRNPGLECILIHLCDMPSVGADHLRKLFSKFTVARDLVFTKCFDVDGVPAVFGRRYFNDLLQLEGDVGAKHLIKQFQPSGQNFVEFEGGMTDVDVPADLEGL